MFVMLTHKHSGREDRNHLSNILMTSIGTIAFCSYNSVPKTSLICMHPTDSSGSSAYSFSFY